MKRISYNAIGAAFALLGAPPIAFASYSHTASAGGTVIGASQTPRVGVTSYNYSALSSSQRQDQAVVSFSSNPIASVALSAQATNQLGEVYFGVGGTMTYSFEVSAQPFSVVPVNFLGVYSAFQIGQGRISQTGVSLDIQSSNAGPYSIVDFRLTLPASCGSAPICSTIDTYYTNGNLVEYTFNQVDPNTVSGSFSGMLNLATDAVGKAGAVVQLAAGVNLHAFPGTAQGSAYIDPKLEIAPSFLAGNPGASLVITSGVGNMISAVPESGTAGMFALGALGLAVVWRRRHRDVAADGNAR